MVNGPLMSISTRNRIFKLLIFGLLALSVRCSASHPAACSDVQIPVADFRQADIVFRLGRTLQSDAIASQGAGGYSHIGLLVEIDSALHVVHIEPTRRGSEKIKAEWLSAFFHPEQSAAGCVMRHSGVNDSLRVVLAGYIKQYLDSEISFDHDYQLSDSARMYCTELVERIYSHIGISLSQGKRVRLPLAKEPVILPSAVYENDSLIEVWSYRAE